MPESRDIYEREQEMLRRGKLEAGNLTQWFYSFGDDPPVRMTYRCVIV